MTTTSTDQRKAPARKDTACLVITGEDRPGIVAAVSGFLSDSGANIVSLDQDSVEDLQGTADSSRRLFQRTVFTLPDLPARLPEFEAGFGELATRRDIDWRLSVTHEPKRVAVMVSKLDHCLLDLLWRDRRGELNCSIGLVIGNHPDLADEVRPFGIPFVHIPVTKETKEAAEAKQLALLSGNFDLVVLARYMQIISGDFLEQVGCPVINIHHSFLPAFIGAAPYRRARERGVKLVGATAHYVTEDLDEGPIIEQDVVRVSHRHSVAELTHLGADVEREVLTRAVRAHCEDRVLRHGNTTVVF
ncbi:MULTISPECIES: formyltetrahydrofolate deformylase [unclassified Streptomyces]|uniref:formyltetrahydrofolate deformylase n=1 Tax=unclassified Streptomyces TaxID=2593676 RepID=UPI00332BF449